MKKGMKGKLNKLAKGSISIFLAFLMSGILSLSALLVESGRYQEARQQLEESCINSAVSLLACFDSDLESRFGLYGIDSETISSDVFLNYLLFNSDATDSGVYSANNISQLYTVTSGQYELKYDLANYQVLKRQLLEYEKYRVPLNMASDMFDVDKMIKEFKKNIEKAIPGLKKMLTICDSISDIAEAIKVLYCLYKDVQQLQLTINSGGEEDIGEMLNGWVGKGWEAVEGLFSDKDWPAHNPSYIVAYNAFKDAVNNKVDYMKANPQPPNPGPKLTADVTALNTAYQNAKTAYEMADLVLRFLEAADELDYCNNDGIVDSTNKISDILNKEITEEELKKLNLTENSTRQKFFDVINDEISSILGLENKFNSFKDSELATIILSLSAKVTSLQSSMQQKKTAYTTAEAELSAWNQKNQAWIAYNNNISSYNTKIDDKKASLLEVIGVVAGELSSYKSSIIKVSSCLDKANDALKKIDEANKNFHSVDKDTESDIFTEIKAQFIIGEEQKPNNGIAFLNGQRDKLNGLSADSITDSYNFDSEFNTGDLLHDSSYYMTKSKVTDYCEKLAVVNVLKGMSDFLDIFKAMGKLIKVMQPFPSMYNWDCVVNLNSTTTDILPSKINGGAGTTESSNGNDIADISAMLEEAKQMLGSGYVNDINIVDPNIRIEEAELSAEISNRITRLVNNFTKLSTSQTTGGLIGSTSWGFISTVFQLLELVPTLVEIINDLVFVAQHIEEAIQIMISSLGENFLLNQYIVEKFPNRTTDTDGNKHNNEISGCTSEPRTYFPDNSKPVQTFSGAQVEYVIGGSYSEKENQQHCFWSIFAIRALNNIFGVLNDEIAMRLISSCNIAAPFVFILWVYLESNIDMNMLVSNMEVPLIKEEIILSPQTLMDNIEQICVAFDDIDETKGKEQELSHAAMKIDYVTEQLLEVKGLFKMKYENYLWFFLFFTPNQTKTIRVADLIQMEMRYKKYYKGTSFELKNLHTYVRCQAEGSFNSILPVLSLSNNTLNGRGFKINCVKYVGY